MGLSVKPSPYGSASTFLVYFNKQVRAVQEVLMEASLQEPTIESRRHSRKVFQPRTFGTATLFDLAPITSFTLGRSLRLRTSGTPGFHGLTGVVYKAGNVFTAPWLMRDY